LERAMSPRTARPRSIPWWRCVANESRGFESLPGKSFHLQLLTMIYFRTANPAGDTALAQGRAESG
jgi:hypothetical protein